MSHFLLKRIRDPRCYLRAMRRGRAHGFRRDEGGVSAIEFAMILPFMFAMYLGVYEASEGFSAYRKVTLLSRSLSDLTSQEGGDLTNATMDQIFAASRAVLAPFKTTETTMTVSSVVFSGTPANIVAQVGWSVTRGGTPRACGALTQVADGSAASPGTIPKGLVTETGSVIVADVKYVYRPLLTDTFTAVKPEGGDAPGTIDLKQTTYMRPRMLQRINYPGATVSCAVV